MRSRTRKGTRVVRNPSSASLKRNFPIKLTVAAAVMLLFFAGAPVVAAMGFEQIESDNAARGLLETLVLISFATIMAGCLSSSLQSLFLSDEVHFLVTLPIPLRVVFFGRFADCAVGALPGGLFLNAAGLGYVLGRGASAKAVLLAIPVVTVLAAVAVFASTIVTAAVIRYGPPRRARLGLTITSLAMLLAISTYWERYGGLGADGQPLVPAGEPWSALAFLPPGWTTAVLAGLAQQDDFALFYVALLFGALLLVGSTAARLFSATYFWNLERTDLARIPPTPRRPPRAVRLLLRLAPRTHLHWVKREWMLVGRDFSRLSGALWPIAGAMIYAAVALLAEAERAADGGDQFWRTHGPLLLFPWAVSMGTSIFAIGAESSGVDLLRSLPVKPWMLLLGKYFAYLIPVAGTSLCLGILAIAFSPGSPGDNALLLILIALLAAVFCGIDVGAAAISPRFGSEQKQRSTTYVGRALAVVAGLAAGGSIVAGLAVSPIGQQSIGRELIGGASGVTPLLWLALMAFGLILPVMSLRLGSSRLAQLLADG